MSLSFSSLVRGSYGILTQLGFNIVKEERALVVYRSGACEVSLFYDDQRSFEVSLGIARLEPVDDPSFSFEEVLRAQHVPQSEWPTGYSARTLEDAGLILEQMGRILGRYASALLNGDQSEWQRLEAQRKADCLGYAKETRLRQARAQAEAAWAKRDYAKVVAALQSVESGWLSKAELAKLDYARRSPTDAGA